MSVQLHSEQIKITALKLYKGMPKHLIDYDEIIQIGNVAVFELYKKNPTGSFNKSFINNNIRWAILNELRARRLRDGHVNARVSSLDTDEKFLEFTNVYSYFAQFITEIDAIEEKLDTEFLMKKVEIILQQYSSRDIQIFNMFFFDEITQAEIGKKFGITGCRVCRILEKMVKHLRFALQDF